MTRHDRRFRFGVQANGAATAGEWLELCATAERHMREFAPIVERLAGG